MALHLLIRKKEDKCGAAKHSMYFLIGKLSSFLLQYLTTERAATPYRCRTLSMRIWSILQHLSSEFL